MNLNIYKIFDSWFFDCPRCNHKNKVSDWIHPYNLVSHDISAVCRCQNLGCKYLSFFQDDRYDEDIDSTWNLSEIEYYNMSKAPATYHYNIDVRLYYIVSMKNYLMFSFRARGEDTGTNIRDRIEISDMDILRMTEFKYLVDKITSLEFIPKAGEGILDSIERCSRLEFPIKIFNSPSSNNYVFSDKESLIKCFSSQSYEYVHRPSPYDRATASDIRDWCVSVPVESYNLFDCPDAPDNIINTFFSILVSLDDSTVSDPHVIVSAGRD